MDNLQRTFKESYVKRLKNEIKAGVSIPKYSSETFEYDPTMLKCIANVYKPEGLLDKLMQTSSDFEAAKVLYESYKHITPLLASTEQFWAYLCHVDLFPYVQKRWGTDLENPEYIEDHWFFGKYGYIRNCLASLWWSIYCSYDESKEDPFELSEILFRNYSFRVAWLKIMLRTKEGLLGILEFLKENPDILETAFENRSRFIAKYVNLIGGVKQLSYLNREFLKSELQKIKPVILKIMTRDDVQNKTVAEILEDKSE